MEIIFSTIGLSPKIFKEPSFSLTILLPTSKALKPLESQYLGKDKSIIKFLQPLLLWWRNKVLSSGAVIESNFSDKHLTIVRFLFSSILKFNFLNF